jgi:hypothetical protein
MASFQDFKDKALSYLAVVMIGGIGYQLNSLNTKVDRLIEVSVSNSVRIDGLERQVYKTMGVSTPIPPYKLPLQVNMREVVAIVNKNDLTPKEYETFN